VAKKTIDQVDVSGKRVLMRVDFNVPVKNGSIEDDRRIRAALASIRSVIDRGGRLVLISHLGRPEGTGYEAGLSLEPCAKRLSELLEGRAVSFPSRDCVDAEAEHAVKNLGDGEIALLENLRFHKEEKRGDPEFARKLAAFGDVYCNDAFGTCHREDASMVATPEAMEGRPRVVGMLVKKEIEYLSETLRDPKRPFVAVLGGAKVADKIGAVENLLPKTDALLIGGAMAYTFLEVSGIEVGASRVESESRDAAHRILDIAAREKCDLHLPTDHICSTEFAEKAGDIETFKESIQPGFMGLDIGPETQNTYSRVISGAKTIVWNGPMGVFEWRPFKVGTMAVAESVADATDRGARTVVGGGDTAAAVETFDLADKFSHVSTGGGASLRMLEGAPFRALELIDEA